MTISRTAYDTTACNSFLMKKTIDSVVVAQSHGQLTNTPNLHVKMVEGGNSVSDAIIAFAHPLEYSDFNKSIYLAIDVRGYGKFDPTQNIFRVRNEMEYKLALHRATLNQVWISDSPTILRDISQLPISIFASWISEAIAKRYALDPLEQLNLAILAAVFYNSQFSNGTELDEREKMRAVNSISRALRVSAQDILNVMDKVSVVSSVADFCSQAEEITGSVRLKEMNTGLLFAILGGTWFANNAKELVAVALEHPPTWLAILLAAFSERSFKNSVIAKITERNSYRDMGKSYMLATLNLINIHNNQ